MALLVYVDDIVIASNCEAEVVSSKAIMRKQFKMNDLGPVKYFLGMEITRSAVGISICQRKYALELPADNGCLRSKPIVVPTKPNQKMSQTDGEPPSDSTTL